MHTSEHFVLLKRDNTREDIQLLKTEIEDLNSTSRDDDRENLTLRRRNAMLKEALKKPTQPSLLYDSEALTIDFLRGRHG